jgi:murein L,D-transpeptidase YcbB/YkuD
VDGIKRFQVRHGLDPDGIVGKATWAALRVPIAWRVRQIELALERPRWLPDLDEHRFIALNIPMFHLWAWDTTPPTAQPTFGMQAIVGRALSTQTPVFVGEMQYVIFRPYWNVPSSILRNEILPVLERDPDYLRRQDMEIVRGHGDDATSCRRRRRTSPAPAGRPAPAPAPGAAQRPGAGQVRLPVTAVVAPESGEVWFAEDIYRHDARLDRALAAHGSGG